MGVWWINQSQHYKEARQVGCIWTPLKDKTGAPVPAAETIAGIAAGDVLVHYVSNRVMAISRARGSAYVSANPMSSKENQAGRRLDVEYFDLETPIEIRLLREGWRRLNDVALPLTREGVVAPGYILPVDAAALTALKRASGHPLPEWFDDVVPAEAALDLAQPEKRADYEALYATLVRSGLYFTPEALSNYLLALQTKRFAILTGISGTGKTQLALSVARFLQPVVRERRVLRPNDRGREIIVREYMKRGRKLILPPDLVAEMTLPNMDDLGTSKRLTIFFGNNQTMRATLYKHPTQNAVQVLFNGVLWEWFSQLQVGDRLFVEPLETQENSPHALRFQPIEQQASEDIERRLDNHVVLAVRPDWTDNQGLLGYYNPMLERYMATPLLRLLMEADEDVQAASREGRDPHPFFVILDEMNLARVEHYFSDFLSCLESGQPLHLHENPLLEAGETDDNVAVPRRLKIPENVYFTGTVNVDETTYMFSPKVLDRAFTIELNEVDLGTTSHLSRVKGKSEDFLSLNGWGGRLVGWHRPAAADWEELGGLLEGRLQKAVMALHAIMQRENRHFGYRVANEIARFINLAAQQADKSAEVLWAATDMAVLEKVLPKFHGTQHELFHILGELFCFALDPESPPKVETGHIEDFYSLQDGHLVVSGKSSYGAGSRVNARLPRLASKVFRMVRRVRQQGFTSFIE